MARGGGALEDLLPFSNETLVRAAAACRTPLVSAIGHEEDAPLLDLVADARASTPTDAAKLVVPSVVEEQAAVRAAHDRLRRLVLGRLDAEQSRLDALRERPALADPGRGLQDQALAVAAARQRAHRAVTARIDRAGDQVMHLRQQVRALSPLATLERGYAVVRTPDGTVLRDPDQVAAGDALRVTVAGGEVAAEVTGAPSVRGGS